MSSFKIIIPEARHIVLVNVRPDEAVIKHVVNLSKTHESAPMIQNHEESLSYDDKNTYSTVWMELLEEGTSPRFLDGSHVLDDETCTMIERLIRDHKTVCVCADNGGVESTKIVPGRSLVNFSHRNGGKDDEECEICVICQEEVETGDDCYTLADCGHLYHEECIEEWLLVDNVCPVCRKTLLSSVYMI